MDQKALIIKSRELRSKASEIKSNLRKTYERRQELYKHSEKLWSEFNPLIHKIKELRKQRDEHTSSVRELKGKRNSAAEQAKNSISSLSQLTEIKHKKYHDLGLKKSPAAIAAEIDRLEYKIETEAIPFEQEKRLTKIIKTKKAALAKVSELSEILKKLKDSSTQIREFKSESGTAHSELRLHAAVSQKFHQDMVECAKKATTIKAQLKPIDVEKTELKTNAIKLRVELKTVEAEIGKIGAQLTQYDEKEVEDKKKAEEQRIADTESELTQKIKSGKKLTNNDLIMLQQNSEPRKKEFTKPKRKFKRY